jgi:hypothetical protein
MKSPIDSGKHGYVRREKRFAKPSIMLQKRKGRKIIPCQILMTPKENPTM